MSTTSKTDLLLAHTFLFAGAVSYLLFRPAILVFDLPFLQSLKFNVHLSNNISTHFFVNHLSDLCWSLYVNLSAWWMQKETFPRYYFYSLMSLPFVSEVVQLFSFIPGTFDPIDLLIYLISFLFFYIINTNKTCNRPNILSA